MAKILSLPSDFKNILIFANMGIGNTINFLPFLESIRSSYPRSKITLLTSSNPSNMVFFRSSNLVDKIMLIKKNSKAAHYIALIKLFFLRFDLILVKWHDDRWIARFLKLFKNALKVGHSSSVSWHGKYDHLLDIKVPLKKDISDLEQYLNLAIAIQAPRIIRDEKIILNKDELEKAQSIINRFENREKEFLVGLHLDVAKIQYYKSLGDKKWIEVISHFLSQDQSIRFILLGVKGEAVSDNVALFFKGHERFTDLRNNYDLSLVACLINYLDILCGNDSSLKTIASAVNTPSIVAVGCTDYNRSCSNKLIDVTRVDIPCSPCEKFGKTDWEHCSHRSCMNELTSNHIILKLSNFINKAKANTK